MMFRSAFGPAFGLALIFAGPACAQGGVTVANPDWARRPTAEDLARHYPKVASRLGIHGRATLSCRVDVKGRLYACSVPEESPAGLGFHGAAIAMSSLFEMRPTTVNGMPADGGTVRIPLRFTLPAPQPSAAGPRAKSPGALAQAHRLLDAQKFGDTMANNALTEVRRLETSRDGSTLLSTRTAAASALRSSIERHRPAFREAFANAYASVFSEADLESMANFALTPASHAVTNDAVLRAMTPAITAGGLNLLRVEAAKAYCGELPCLAPSDVARVWRPVSGPRGELLDAPVWDATPTRWDLNTARPPIAALLGLAGAVRMTCYITGEGALSDCKADEEAPAGIGFGEAAVKLADEYELNDVQLSQGLTGRRVTVRLGFAAPKAPETVTPPEPQSEEGLALAREVVASFNGEFQLKPLIERRLTELEVGNETQQERVARRVFEGAADRTVADIYDRMARALAAIVRKEELKELLAFRKSAAGKAQMNQSKALAAALMAAQRPLNELITRDARAEFCRIQACEPDAPVKAYAEEEAALKQQ